MSAETGPADGSAPAAQSAGVSGSAAALAQLESWHHDLVALVDGWAWIRTLNDQLTAVLAPWRERYQDNPVLELMHGGRWLGHPLHPALSDLPIGLWAGSLLLDITAATRPPEGPASTPRACSPRPASSPRSRPPSPAWSTGPSATTRTAGSACSTGCSTRPPSGCRARRWRPG